MRLDNAFVLGMIMDINVVLNAAKFFGFGICL